jgi:uncharacterized protein (DUF433 family)
MAIGKIGIFAAKGEGPAGRPTEAQCLTAASRVDMPGNIAAPSQNDAKPLAMNYQDIISIEPGKRGGRPCIRHMRIAVADVLGWLAAGQTHAQILEDFPELTEDDIRACLAYAADRERRFITAST